MHERIEAIFNDALDRAGDERASFLESVCGGDVALRSRVLELIDAHDGAGTMLQPAAGEDHDQMIGRQVGRFTVDRLLASGGMGSVYLATQDRPRRPVALKLMRWGLPSRSAWRRFEFESQVLGRLRHPNIAQIHEAGTHEHASGSVPYFAMEYVPDARSITAYAEDEQLDTRERLALFRRVCDAVHHGHQKGVIHRDLKPSNVLVDPTGEPKVIDFGVAKATDSDLTVTTLQGDVGALVGTLQYMSPEQCGGDAADLDTRSDVYGLGVVMYELLCGRPPYDVSRVPFPDAARVIREDAPTKPSTVSRTLRGDVERIVLKALEKDRDHRYQSAADLGRDIDHYLRGEAIEARPPSVRYTLGKFVRRNRLLVGAAGSVAVVLVLATIGMGVLTSWALRERADAQRERNRAEEVTRFVEDALVAANPRRGGETDVLVVEAMEQALAELDAGALQGQPETEATLRSTISRVLRSHGRPEEAIRQARRALEINLDLYPGDHVIVAESHNLVGMTLWETGFMVEALAAFRESLPMFRRLFPGENLRVARELHNVATCLSEIGQSAEALDMLRTALEMKRSFIEGDDPSLVASMNTVALCLIDFGREEEALGLAEEGLEMIRRLQPAPISVGVSLNTVGLCEHALGRPADAMRRHEAAIDILEAAYGKDSAMASWSFSHVAWCLESLGHAAEALPIHEKVHEIGLQEVAAGYVGDLNTFWLGRCLRALDRPEEALDRYRAALEAHRRKVPVDNRYVAAVLEGIASCLESLRWSEEALPTFEEALEIARRFLPPGHPEALRPQIGMARTLTSLGEYADAEPLLLDAAAHCDRSDVAWWWHGDTVVEEAVRLYEAWHAAEPDEGHDVEADEWRVKLEEITKGAAGEESSKD